ncbi:hypothetical protein C8A05DRAFT_29517 [Staphylotrichum tortipilum]|uniref:Protein kinase domain-containing protein n=1 Tax=Staphylotrichum tortipilum TaxID=2831512 RepID=A0AAN6MU59_9PEZI|nr:hypothetical protein C8A05DRAFT_29517 [Staphylotrichum longicolle]
MFSQPGTPEISALSYRSPELLFGKPWDYSTDVWSWGIIVDIKFPGMYDNISVGTLEEKTKAVRDAIAVDFDLHSHPQYAEDLKAREMLPPPQPELAYKWDETMVDKGVAGEDIQFLANILSPLRGARFTTVEILESGYLDG